MTLIDIFLILLIVIFSALGIYLIIVVKKLSFTLDKFDKDFSELKRETSPFIKDVGEITKSVSAISKIVEDQVEYVNDKVEWVKSKINAKTDSSKKSPQDNAQNLVTNLKAVSKGVSTFVKEIKK